MEKKLYEKPQLEILVFVPSNAVQTWYDENGVWHDSGEGPGEVVSSVPDDWGEPW